MKPICVIKIGGAVLDASDSVKILVSSIEELSRDWQVVVVHGGGPQATRMATQFGHAPKIVEGRRVTSKLDLEIVQATVCGTINVQLVGALVGVGVRAVGISGAAGDMIHVSKRPPWSVGDEWVDFGHVGDIESIDPAVVETLLAGGFVPVIATIGVDDSGRLYNVNADTTAAAVAVALHADRFCLVTDSGGLKKDGRMLDVCDDALYESGKADQWITDGMVVKLKAGFEALDRGVARVELTGCDGLIGANGTRLVHSTETVDSV